MVRKAKDVEAPGGAVHPDMTAGRANGISESALKMFVNQSEEQTARIDEIMRDAAIACQPYIDEKKAIAKKAAEAGCPKKVFNAKLRERKLLRRAEAQRGTLSEEQAQIYDEISAKLGPLGEWAKREATDGNRPGA